MLASLGVESNFNSFPEQNSLDKQFGDRITTEIIQGRGFTSLKYPINKFITLVMERMDEELKNVLVFHDTIDNDILVLLLKIKKSVSERKMAIFFEEIYLPLTWESTNLAYLGSTLTEINTAISPKKK